jgi:hypothetical protein
VAPENAQRRTSTLHDEGGRVAVGCDGAQLPPAGVGGSIVKRAAPQPVICRLAQAVVSCTWAVVHALAAPQMLLKRFIVGGEQATFVGAPQVQLQSAGGPVGFAWPS